MSFYLVVHLIRIILIQSVFYSTPDERNPESINHNSSHFYSSVNSQITHKNSGSCLIRKQTLPYSNGQINKLNLRLFKHRPSQNQRITCFFKTEKFLLHYEYVSGGLISSCKTITQRLIPRFIMFASLLI